MLIEVDPEAPKRAAAAPPPPRPEPARPAPAAPAAQPAQVAAPAAPQTPRPDDRGGPRRDRDRGDRDRGGDRGRSDRPARTGRDNHARPRPDGDRLARVEADSFAPPTSSAGLITLPEIPRLPSERFPEATGPLADAAARGMELLLRIAGLNLTPRILQGEERLEVDLSGEDVDWCFADDGELVGAVEHLLPRLIRSLAGEAPLVRVDCDNFQEIREERLRSLAQQVAEEVRRKGRPSTLEPMNPADRRIVHITLADDPGVVSESSGDGYFKRVTIRPA